MVDLNDTPTLPFSVLPGSALGLPRAGCYRCCFQLNADALLRGNGHAGSGAPASSMARAIEPVDDSVPHCAHNRPPDLPVDPSEGDAHDRELR